MKLTLGGVFILTLTCSALASDLTLFGGWAGPGSVRTATESVDLRNFSALGIRFENGLAFLGFENSLTYYTNPIVAEGSEGNPGVSYTGNLVVNVPILRPQPFFVVGLGLLHKFGSSQPDIGTSLMTNYGGGLKLPRIAGPVGLRIEYRRLTIYDVLEEKVGSHELSGGVLFSF